jgi:hypothetical protein
LAATIGAGMLASMTKLSKDVVEKLMDNVVFTHGNLDAACKLTHVARQSVYARRDRDRGFAAALERARLAGQDFAIDLAQEQLLRRRFGTALIEQMSDRALVRYLRYRERKASTG